MSDSYELTEVDLFTAHAVGVPGARTFYFQVVSQGTSLSFKCEKQHVEALATALAGLLSDLPPVQPALARPAPQPDKHEWTVGSIALGFEAPESRVVVVFEEVDGQGASTDRRHPSAENDGAQLRFVVTLAQAQAFINHGTELVKAGRPGCALCGSPIDAFGYHCACFN
jgi:uncharacterized repeat protein (TIGR03847 family)